MRLGSFFVLRRTDRIQKTRFQKTFMRLLDFLKNLYHYALALLGNIWYGFPSRTIFLIGVTGTKGKSTVVELMNAVLEAAGKKTALLSSVRVKILDRSEKNVTGNTMPGRFFIHRFLRDAVRAGAEFAILEVTSQGVVQYRHRFLNFDAALFLNLHPEHIESHGSFEGYRSAKVQFFSDVARRSAKPRKLFFVNQEDHSREYFFDAVHGFGDFYYFSREHFIATRLMHGKVSIGDWLANDFNLENAAAVAKVAEAMGIDWGVVQRALAAFPGVPGRMDVIQEKPFRVVVDYAHTPDSLRAAYQALTQGRKKLICVLGSDGGGRDKWKRPELGKIAGELCRDIVLTEENPYDEDPRAIIGGIRKGIPAAFPESHIYEFVDRRAAIAKAISFAKSGDTVVMTGKGSEGYIRRAHGEKIPWDERSVAEELLRASR